MLLVWDLHHGARAIVIVVTSEGEIVTELFLGVIGKDRRAAYETMGRLSRNYSPGRPRAKVLAQGDLTIQ